MSAESFQEIQFTYQRLQQAVAAVEHAYQHYQDELLAHYRRRLQEMEQAYLTRQKQAQEGLQAALLSAPQDARLYNNLGLAARQRGDTEAARGYFERAAELAPEWDLPRRNLEELTGSR